MPVTLAIAMRLDIDPADLALVLDVAAAAIRRSESIGVQETARAALAEADAIERLTPGARALLARPTLHQGGTAEVVNRFRAENSAPGHSDAPDERPTSRRRKSVRLEGGERIYAHRRRDCLGPPCPIHHRTDHHMRTWPQHWRTDRALMERTCPHGIGHPDPDQRLTDGGVHGCDLCCRPPDTDDGGAQ